MAVDEADLTTLVRAAGAGHQPSWDALVQRFTGLLWAVARGHRLDSGDAGDVVQTTWMRLVEKLDQVEDPERLGGWLATTARRESLAVLRRRQREAPTADDAFLDVVATSGGAAVGGRSGGDVVELDSRLLASERDAQLARLFGALSGPCQRLLRVLMADPAPSYAEVSASLDMPIGSIGPSRGRCLDRLRVLALGAGVTA